MAPRRILRQSEQDAIFREAGAPEHPDAQWRADYLRKLYDNATHHNDPGVTGGPTMNAEDLPQSGTMVSIPGAEKQYPTMPSSQQVKEYFDTHHFGPEDYPGGWEWPPANDPSHHDTPRFYMDESRNYADPWEAGQAALEGDQIGVYDLSGDWSEQGKPSSVLTNQFINDQIAKGGARVGQSTHDTRRGTRPSGREVSQSGTGRGAGTAGSPPVRRANRRSLDAQGVGSAHDSDAVFDWTPAHLASLPDHDWTQHVLGDRDMWIIARLAAPAATMQPYTPGSVKAFDPTGLKPSKGAGGSHGATIYSGPNGEWVIKQPPPDAPYLAYVDVAANHIAQMSGVDTPDTFLSDGKAVGLKPGPISAQVRFPGAKDAYPNKQFDPEKVSDDDLLTIQKHHALDWLLSNHDSHPMGFIRLQDGRLAGIDKGQAAKYFGQDRLHWNFHPNQDYKETEPVYNTLYRNFATGGRQILDPSQGELAKYIQHLQAIPDKEYADIWRPYAEAAAKQGALCHPWHHTGLVPSTIPPNDVEAFLKAAVERKHNLAKDFADLYARAVAHRMTGTKIARSQKVFPATSDSYGTDRAGSHPQSPREGRIAQAALSDPSDIGFGESSPGALIPRRREATVDGFDGVVGLGPGVEMGRLAADFPVAPVQDEGFVGGDRIAGIEDAVRHDMGSDNPLPHHQLSVPRRGKRGGPVPAASFLQPDEFPVSTDFDRRGGRITGHVPPEGFFLREVEGAVGAGTLSHIDTSTVGHAPGLFPQARERSLHQAYADTLPLDWDGNEPNPQPLYRGAVLDLRGPGADQVRRSLLGRENEDIYGPGEGRFAPCRGCPHPIEKIRPPKPGNGTQGALPLGRDYSDHELATTGKARWTQMGRDILDLIGDGDDTEWTDDPNTAQKNALSGTGPLQLPVMLGKTQRPDGNPDIDSVRIVHPQTGHWYEIMPGKYQELEARRRPVAPQPVNDRYASVPIRLGYAPDPSSLVNLNKQMGSHGAQLWKDPQGEWLLKKPGKNQEFMIPLDVATSQLQQSVGLEGPEVHAIPMPHPKGGSYLVAAHRMYPGATQAWQRPPHLADVHPDDLLTLQKHQAMDWLIANHDPHVGNFMRTDKGLVGVDKGQALKYFGRDRLDWNFHPNYYAREPIYNNLWREYAHGLPGEMNDPREGDLGDFIARVQSIPDDKLKEMFYPYATAAARVGLLATGDNDPQRGQTYPRVKPNDPEAFLDALVQRKNHLADDLGELYDRAATHRASASLNQLGGEPLTKPKKLKPRQQLMWAPQYGPGKHELGRPQTKTPDYWQLPEDWDDEGYEDDEW